MCEDSKVDPPFKQEGDLLSVVKDLPPRLSISSPSGSAYPHYLSLLNLRTRADLGGLGIPQEQGTDSQMVSHQS